MYKLLEMDHWRREGGGGLVFEMNDFFFVSSSLVGIFFPYARAFFLGYSLCITFLLSNFHCVNFLYFPHPHNFSNGPSLILHKTKQKKAPIEFVVV